MREFENQCFGGFRLVEYIGSGGFATVYRGERTDTTKEQVAVKILHLYMRNDSEKEAFVSEAAILSKLDHPNIVKFLEYGVKPGYGEKKEAGLPYIAMSLGSQNLEQRCPLGKQVPLEVVRSYVKQIASALQYAHDNDVIHLDLKPKNILVERSGNILVCDFGLARFIEGTHQTTSSRDGTYYYMAPEQYKGQLRRENDQYALGIIIYQWLCGNLPFTGSNAELMRKHLRETPLSLRRKRPDLSKDLEQVILRSLEKDPKKRFESVCAFASAFERACQSSTKTSPPLVRIFPLGVMLLCLVLLVSLAGRGEWAFLTQQHLLNSQHATATAQAATFATATAALTAYNTAIASNGIQFGFDAQHTHDNPYERMITSSTVKHLIQAWTAQTDSNIFFSPVVANGMVYISGSTDNADISPFTKLYAFKADGCGQVACAPLWTAQTDSNLHPSNIDTSPAVANGVVYVGASNKLYAFKADGCGQVTCTPLWTAQIDDALYFSPVVANGMIYVGSFNTKLYVFNADGCGQMVCAPLWTDQTDSSIDTSPAVANGVVYIGAGDKLYAFKADGCGQVTCAPLWTDQTDGIIDTSPAIANGVVYVGSTDHRLYAFKTGGCGQVICDRLWRTQTADIFADSFTGGPISDPAVANGIVSIGSFDGNLYAFKADGCGRPTCAPLWADRTDGIDFSLAIANGVIYTGLYAFKADGCGRPTCAPLWTAGIDMPNISSDFSPAVATAVVTTYMYTIYKYKPFSLVKKVT